MMKLDKTAIWGLALVVASLGTSHAKAEVVVTNAWVRATVQGQEATAAYMRIQSDHDTALIGAASDVADHAALHEMQRHGEMMMMMPIERIPVLAKSTVVLDEHNYHVMLEGLKHQIKVGETVVLTLRFVDAKGQKQNVTVQAVARELSALDKQGAHDHM